MKYYNSADFGFWNILQLKHIIDMQYFIFLGANWYGISQVIGVT